MTAIRHARIRALGAAAAGAGLLASAHAHAQSAAAPATAVQPAAGFTAPSGGLRDQLDRQAPGGGPSLQPGLIITPSIAVDVGATDNPSGLNGVAGNTATGPDAFVVVTPGLQVSGETARVRVNAGYTPSITRYLQTGSQNTIYQNLFGSANVTVVPDAVFVAATGSITQQSRTGGSFYNNGIGSRTDTTTLNRNDLGEVYNFSITPYAAHRFGGTGTAQVGYTFAYTSSNGQDGTFGDGGGVFNQQSYNGRFASTQPLLTNREFATFTTGEDFGRINSVTSLQATQFSGSGIYGSNSRRNLIVDDVSYAVNRLLAVIGRVGFEDVRYGGFPPTRIDDVVWRAGVRLTPNPDSTITLAYGHSDGIDSAFVNASYTPTARTRVDVSYSAGLTTDLEDIQNTAVVSRYDAGGTTYNQFTGGPIGSSAGFYGIDNNLFRLRRLAVTGTLLYDRDTFSVTLADERRTIVAAASAANTALLGTTDGGTYGTLTWEHQLSPVLTSSVSASVGTDRISGSGGGSQTTYGLLTGLFYQLSPTVSTTARYIFQKRTGDDRSLSAFNNGFDSRAGTVNTVLFGVRKSF